MKKIMNIPVNHYFMLFSTFFNRKELPFCLFSDASPTMSHSRDDPHLDFSTSQKSAAPGVENHQAQLQFSVTLVITCQWIGLRENLNRKPW